MELLSLDSDVRLKNGVAMPMYGLGLSHNGGFSADAVSLSLDLGVRMLDTAERYGNEAEVGQILALRRAQPTPAPPPFITTKLWPGSVRNETDVSRCCAASCDRLGVDSVDCYLVHWPGMWGAGGSFASNREYRRAVWRQMELLLDSGRARAIGVSNFLAPHLDELGDSNPDGAMTPLLNQIELNPLQNPTPLLRYCEERGIVVEGYCPLGKGEALHHPVVRRVAASVSARAEAAAAAGETLGTPAREGSTGHEQVTEAQVLLRWALQKGVVSIPKSTRSAHIRSNLRCFAPELALAAEEMSALDDLHCDLRVTWDPTGVD